MRSHFLAAAGLAAVLALSGCTKMSEPTQVQADAAPPATSGKTVIGSWGFDVSGMDRSVKPGEDFYAYSIGQWVKSNPIPPDRVRWGSFDILAAKAEKDILAIIQEVAQQKSAPGTPSQKIADHYASYLDTAGIEAKGLEPFKADLAAMAGAKDHTAVAVLMASPSMATRGPIGGGLAIDAKNPDRYVLSIRQSGLGLPNRDFYLKTDEKSVALRAQYAAYIAKMLKLAGYPGPDQAAQTVMATELKIAEAHWPRDKQRNRDLTYNLKTQGELKAFAPDYPWTEVYASLGIPGHNVFVVAEADAVQKLAALFKATPVETWRAYMTFHYLNAQADIMPKAFDEASFAFNGKALGGQQVQRDRWKRAVASTNGALGEAVGQIYVARHFPPDSKAKMLALVERVRDAYRVRIKNLSWMSSQTKEAAIRKLEALRPKIGYPDKWRDYSSLEIKAGDVYGNRRRTQEWNWAYDVARLPRPTDRDEWFMTPQTVNAYYSSVYNDIVFPAAILQAPFFDPNADDAINYGGIGGVIGHEMGHGFDDQGSKSDERGILRTWWGPDDVERFKALTKRLADQYAQYSPLPGLNLNGALTLGENIGDLGGLSVSFEAYKSTLGGRPAPVIDGFTGEQRFFLGWAQVWRGSMRDEAMRTQVLNGPHSPPKYRVNGVVPNIDGWYTAFGVEKGQALYLPQDKRVSIW